MTARYLSWFMFVAAIVCVVGFIWTGDDRWIKTAAFLLVICIGVVIVNA